MPNRLIREGIVTSEKVNKLSWPAECFYRRLMSVADDYGCFDAHESLLRSACYPLKLDQVTNKDISDWLKECLGVRSDNADDPSGLINIYEVDGKRYLQILNFRQTLRIKRRKYPMPPEMAPVVKTQGDPNAHYCQRQGHKVPCSLYGSYVLLLPEEYERMITDWGEVFAKNAIKEFDLKYPNSKAIQNYTDHNRGIRDWVNRGFICQGKQPKPATREVPKPTPPPPNPEEEEKYMREYRESMAKLGHEFSTPESRNAESRRTEEG